ncbi:MAG: hypothetical protein AB7S48_07705 [Bacteroidales bacterium]
MKQIYLKWSALAAMLIAGLEGCYDFKDKFDNISIDPISPKLVAPVLNSSISFKELAERDDANTVVVQKPGDTKFYLAFRDTIEVGSAAAQFTIPSIAFDNSYQLDAGQLPPVAVPAGETYGPISKDFTNTYEPVAGSELKSITLTQGTLNCQITNNFQNIISGTITLTSLLNPQGNSVVIVIPNINPGNSSNLSSIDLTDHIISLYNSDLNAYNTFSYSASVSIYSLGNPISSSDNVNIQLSLDNLDFSYIVGKINQNIAINDYDYKVDIFRSTYIADQHFEEAKLKLKFINEYGIPFAFNVTNFEVTNTTSDEIVYLANEGIPSDSTLLISAPNNINYVENIGDNAALDSLVLYKDNSNIEDVLDIAPNQFKLRSSVTLGDNTDNHDYFISKDANLSILSEIELPLVGWVETNQINDTIVDIELPDLEDKLNLKDNDSLKITVKFKFNNDIPLDTYFQAYFLNDMDQELTKLLDDELWLIKSAEVSPSTGKAIAPTLNYAEITVNRSKYSLMKDATKIVLQVRFKTGGDTHQTVVIENTNSIDIQMSIIAEGTYNFDL